MKCFSWLTGILMPFQFAMGQESATLTVGDRLSPSRYNYIQHHPALKAPIPNLFGKWIILDFMATNCLSCIKAIPGLDSLQKKYAGNLQVLLVTKQPKTTVASFFARNNFLKGSVLPVIVEDSVLAAIFPHQVISHEVWIDPKGIVRAITGAEYVNNQNIAVAVSAKPFNLPLKTDEERAYYNGSTPLVEQQPATKFYSAIQPYNKQYIKAVTLQEDTAAGTVRLSLVNWPILDMYRYSVGSTHHKPSQVQLNIRDTAALVFNSTKQYWQQWEPKNSFCYEATYPAGTSTTIIKQCLQRDLDTWFGLKSDFQKQVIDCYVITASDQPPTTVAAANDNAYTVPLSDILFKLNNQYFSKPVLDERANRTRLLTNIPPTAIADIDALQQQLLSYGLALRTQPREILVLTISENKKPNN